MRILYISYLFQPNREIGAVRPSNMCRYLASFGHEVTLFTAEPEAASQSGGCDAHVVPHSKLIRRTMEKLAARARARKAAGAQPNSYAPPDAVKPGLRTRLRTAINRRRLWLWDFLCQYDWAVQARRVMRKQLRRDYDVTISSFGPLGSLFLGLWAAGRRLAPVWIADMRDTVDNALFLPAERRFSRRLERRTLRRADLLLTISHGVGDHFRALARNDAQRDKIAVLENGFEPGSPAAPAPADGVLRLVYTGTLYEGRYVFTAAMKAVAALIDAGDIPADGIELHYAGPHGHEFLCKARETGVETQARDHGQLSRAEALALQEQGDILCVLAWNGLGIHGWLPAKFWEYLRAERPVLSIIAGEEPQAELTHWVQTLGVGFAYEEATAQRDEPLLRDWLLAASRRKAAGEPLPYAPERDKVLDFRYDHRARHMEQLCLALTEKKE